MKKIILCVLTAFLLTSCTSKQQDEQINSFWKGQLISLFAKLGMRPAEKPTTIPDPMLLDENGQPLFPEQEALQEEHPSSEKLQETLPAGAPKPVEDAETTAKPTGVPATQKTAKKPTSVSSNRVAVTAVLFIHSDSPQSKQLKADNWKTTFQQKYQGRIAVVEYDMKNPASPRHLHQMMRRHKLSSVTVPILFVGNQSLQGYPFHEEDEAVRKALLAAAKAKKQPAQKAKKQPEQFMEIIMEDTLKVQKPNTIASPRDNHAMQLALASVERNNQAMLVDMGSLFGEDTKAQAYAIISRTERLLRNKASASPDYKTYLATQKTLLQLQERELNQLMRKNSGKIRAIRG